MLFECVVCNVDICYLTKLMLASGHAYSCDDRSRVNIKGEMYLLLLLLGF